MYDIIVHFLRYLVILSDLMTLVVGDAVCCTAEALYACSLQKCRKSLWSCYKQENRSDSCVFLHPHSWFTLYSEHLLHAITPWICEFSQESFFQLAWLTLLSTINPQDHFSNHWNYNPNYNLQKSTLNHIILVLSNHCFWEWIFPSVHISLAPSLRNLEWQ